MQRSLFRYLVLLAVGVAVTLGVMTPLAARAARADMATLNKIASRVEDRTGFLLIEASDPVPYVASQPDPQTFVVELRDVVANDPGAHVRTDAGHPIASVRVENGFALDGANVARVSMTLTRAMRPRIRSARNVIVVEADRADLDTRAGTTGAGAISLAGPAAVIRDLRVTRRGNATAVTLMGTAHLMATSVTEPKDGTRRLVLDLPNVTSLLQTTTPIGQGPVERVRISLSPRSALLTQVTMDLSRAATYRVESSAGGQDLTVVFDEPVGDPVAAIKASVLTPDRPVVAAAAQAPVPIAQAVPAPVAAQAVAAAQAPQAAQPVVPPVSRYTGHAVSLDFQGADLRAVLRTFAEISGLNIVIDPTIQGTVDVSLRDVPWDQALDIILRANRLGYGVDGTIVRIAPLAVLADEESQRRKLQDEQALAGELRVLTKALSYAKAEDLKPLLLSTALSQRGQIQTDTRTNTIIINDLPDRLERAAALIAILDVSQPQVEIEARIVQTNRTFANSLGVKWGFSGRAIPALGNTTALAFPNQGTLAGGTGSLDSVAKTTAALALGSVNGAFNLDVALSALESSGQGRILSTPRIATQNNVAAEITQGVQIPIQTVANNTVTVTFKDATLSLKVTPQITAAGTVIMQITVENAVADFSKAVNGIPPIDTQRALTQVLVADGETTVIGGIYVSQEQATRERTPGLSRLPLLGWLFKTNSSVDESRELLIFITPKIARL